MTAVDQHTQVITTLRVDSALLEADLRQFLAELPTGTTPLQAAFHEPVTDALGSKVGQEATAPAGQASAPG